MFLHLLLVLVLNHDGWFVLDGLELQVFGGVDRCIGNAIVDFVVLCLETLDSLREEGRVIALALVLLVDGVLALVLAS